ncbi:MAG: hypothetical protein R2856_16520 [Caldilineaceae bacterium]
MRALITGAADGIRRALSFACGRAGYNVLGVDIDEARSLHTSTGLEAMASSIDSCRPIFPTVCR